MLDFAADLVKATCLSITLRAILVEVCIEKFWIRLYRTENFKVHSLLLSTAKHVYFLHLRAFFSYSYDVYSDYSQEKFIIKFLFLILKWGKGR